MVEVNSTHHQKEANPNVCSPIYLLWIIFCVFCLPQCLYMVKYEFQIHVIIVHCCIGPHYLSCPFSSAWSADICEHSEISRDYISLRQKEARPGYDGKPLFTAFFQALGIGMRLPFHNNTVTCTSAAHRHIFYTQQSEEVLYTATSSKFTPTAHKPPYQASASPEEIPHP